MSSGTATISKTCANDNRYGINYGGWTQYQYISHNCASCAFQLPTYSLSWPGCPLTQLRVSTNTGSVTGPQTNFVNNPSLSALTVTVTNTALHQ